jgi:hypothetical protein
LPSPCGLRRDTSSHHGAARRDRLRNPTAGARPVPYTVR